MWYLTRLAIRNRAITFLLAALLTGAAVWGTLQMKMELIPDIDFPFNTVLTVYPDASPEEVVDEVTTPIEGIFEERWEGRGLKHIFSTSAAGISIIFAEFDYGTDMDQVGDSLRDGFSDLGLPEEVLSLPQMNPQLEENPRILPIDLSMMPLVVLTLSGDYPQHELKEIAETEFLPELADLEGVFSVEIEGGDREKVVIAPDPIRMEEYGVSMYQIAALVTMGGDYDSLGGLENAPMGVDSVVLGNMATSTLGPAPTSVIARTNGAPSVAISVTKDGEANTVDVANAVVERAEEILAQLDGDFELVPMLDQSEFIEESIGQLLQMALIGGILAIVVVFLFLMAFRASLVTAMSIPLSVVIGFLVMYASSITINLLTLSAMAIAIGRLIDNSIVIAEVVYRRLKDGEVWREAALNGAREVATPITASTLATVAIFLPIGFVGGIVGEMFIPFALTLTFALIASLIVALVVVPAFSGWFVGKKQREVRKEEGGRRDNFYQAWYVASLKWVLRHRAITLVVTLVLFLGSFAILPVIGTSFMPAMSEKMLTAEVHLPPGTELQVTSDMVAQLETLIDDYVDDVESYYSNVGTSTSLMGAMSTAMGGGDNTAEITIMLEPDADVDKERDALDSASDALRGLIAPGSITIYTGEAAMSSQMGLGGLDISVVGQDPEKVNLAARQLYASLAEIEGISNIEAQLSMVVPTLDVELDPAKAMALGLTKEQILGVQQEMYLLEAGSSLNGVQVSADGESYGVFLKGISGDLYNAEEPEKLTKALMVGYPQSVALGDIAQVALVQSPTHISHYDMRFSAGITGTIDEKDVGAINRLVEDEVDSLLAAPGLEGVDVEMGGVAEEMNENFARMGIAIVGAMVIAFLTLVLTMRSVVNPIIIMVSLPLASIGALLGLLIAGYTLDMSGMMGVLMLVGIVLTNAIVLIALVEQLRKKGVGTYEALVEGGRTRLRPILMTALTTMVAMIPLAVGVGEGTILAAELAVVVIGGLFSSTLLTLLVIPVIYSLVDGVRQRVKAR